MTETRNKGRYDRIGSLSELRTERERLDWMIEAREGELVREWGRFREMFSIGYVTGVVTQKMEHLQALVRTAYSGFQTALSLFRREREEGEEDAAGAEENV